MVEKITSIRIDKELWKKAKILAIKRGIVLKDLVEEVLSSEVRADELAKSIQVSQELMQKLQDRVDKGEIPFTIVTNKTAVELVKEGRGR
jgi:predicted DNA-binding ribbon-helix-helix protein